MSHKDTWLGCKGDTIVEVMFATAITGLVIVIAMAVMGRGIATAQMAVEHTMVRQGIDGQAEALRYLRDNKADETSTAWGAVLSRVSTGSGGGSFGDCSKPLNAFYINTTTLPATNMVQNASAEVSGGEVFATPGRGMWIDARQPSASSRFIDFHIVACWEPPFSGPDATIGTIVRLMK